MDGDGLAVVTWDTLPDLTYWIFYQPGSTVDVATPNSIAIRRAFSPRVVGPLANGVQYAFVMNATHDDSAAGPNSLPALANPRLAGDVWVSGTALGTPPQNLNSIVFSGSRFVTVGDAGTIFAGDFNYTNVDPLALGVTEWMPPTLPPGFTSNLSSVIFNGSFIALGTDGSVISSADGVTWVSNNPIQVNGIQASGMNGIAFGFAFGITPTYVAVGNGGAIYMTHDLVTWNSITPPATPNDLTSVSVLNGSFLATGVGGTLLTSPDGSTWSSLSTNTTTTSTLRGIAFSAISGIYVAVGDAGTIITSTDNTASWTLVPAPLAQDLRGVTTGGAAGTRFLAVGQGGAVVYSDDGLQWRSASSGTASLAKVLFVGGMYLGVGDAGANAVSK